jgi:hypothetical protein
VLDTALNAIQNKKMPFANACASIVWERNRKHMSVNQLAMLVIISLQNCGCADVDSTSATAASMGPWKCVDKVCHFLAIRVNMHDLFVNESILLNTNI